MNIFVQELSCRVCLHCPMHLRSLGWCQCRQVRYQTWHSHVRVEHHAIHLCQTRQLCCFPYPVLPLELALTSLGSTIV